MTATLATLPLDTILSISAFLSNPLDVLSLSRTCRSAFLTSQAWASYWTKLVPAAHLSRPAPWNSYSPSELRDAHIRYAATHRQWESPSPTFKPPIQLPPPPPTNIFLGHPQYWRVIRGTRWAWFLHHSKGEVSFCDLRSGLVIGKWSAGGPVVDAFIESRSPNECVLCHGETNQGDNIGEVEIVVTSVTFEQDNLISPITLSFRTIQRSPVEEGILLWNKFSSTPMVLWRNYLIGSYFTTHPWTNRTAGLFLRSMTDNSIFCFEMEVASRCTEVVDDVLFVTRNISDSTPLSIEFCCIHIPSLVISTQLLGGSLSLTENAFAILLPKCIMKFSAAGTIFTVCSIYSIPACPPTHPRYCFIIKRFLGESRGVEWEVLEVEIDLSIPGPIKTFSRVSRQYTVQRPTYSLSNSDDDLLLYLPLGCADQPLASPSVRFLRVGKPDKWRVARLAGIDKWRVHGLSVDRDAGLVFVWAVSWSGSTPHCGFIYWLDERKAGDTVYSRTKELISSWSRGRLRRF